MAVALQEVRAAGAGGGEEIAHSGVERSARMLAILGGATLGSADRGGIGAGVSRSKRCTALATRHNWVIAVGSRGIVVGSRDIGVQSCGIGVGSRGIDVGPRGIGVGHVALLWGHMMRPRRCSETHVTAETAGSNTRAGAGVGGHILDESKRRRLRIDSLGDATARRCEGAVQSACHTTPSICQ
mgnify:CR=1 FL=1